MTYEQRGMYMDLLCVAWNEKPGGTLPADDDILAALLNIDAITWNRHRAIVLGPFLLKENRYCQKRMVRVHKEQITSHKKRSESGKKGNAKRWHSDRNAIPTQSQSESESESESEEGRVRSECSH